ncbi:MAG: YfcE family phosphodiesterase [Desulfobacterales bacterium]|nr:YfcE family phosphodiesterase [Desulfobacterales bacterium]
MKIGVISDTHLSEPDERLYRLADHIFADADMILHAGDLVNLAVLKVFSDKKVISVRGNMDRQEVAAKLPDKEIIAVGRFRIGLIHGWGSPRGIEDKIKGCFTDVNAIVYGHTHKAANHLKDGLLFFNPGAFSGTFLMGRNRSVGVLIVSDTIEGAIIRL